MTRVAPLSIDEAPPESRAELEGQLAAHGRVTNMKCTLAHSPPALLALMEWYPLYDEVVGFLGRRATTLFVHAISTQTDCLICSTFFRRWLTEQGENPDALVLDEREQALVDYGRQMAVDANNISDELYRRVSRGLDSRQIVTLTAFAGMMIATNVFNNALQVPLDEYLHPFAKSPVRRAAGAKS